MEELENMYEAYKQFEKDCNEFIEKYKGEKNENICK